MIVFGIIIICLLLPFCCKCTPPARNSSRRLQCVLQCEQWPALVRGLTL
jgi:hypothetical protein